MVRFNLKNWIKKSGLVGAIITCNVSWAYRGSDLPFNSTLDTLKEAISGPFLVAAAIIMIVITCLMLAFGEWGDGFKKLINIVLWLSIAFGSVSFVSTMFGAY